MGSSFEYATTHQFFGLKHYGPRKKQSFEFFDRVLKLFDFSRELPG